LKEVVPYGGHSDDAGKISWPNLCYESEVNSRDLNIKRIYEANRDLFNDLSFPPTSLAGILGNLSVKPDKLSSPQVSCAYFKVLKEMFPGLPFKDSKTMMDFFSQLDVEKGMFSEILKNACSDKSGQLKTKPNYQRFGVDADHPIAGNEIVLANVDQALMRGRVPTIYYRSSLFNKDNFDASEEPDHHASAVVGKMNVCGEPHYIVRNSWGAGACKNNQEFIQVSKPDKVAMDRVALQESACETEADRYYEKSLENCAGNEQRLCRDKVLSIRVAFEKQCLARVKSKKYEAMKHNFFCDKQGNYIVSESYLKRAAYDSVYINN